MPSNKKYTRDNTVLLGFSESMHHAEDLAALMQLPYAEVDLHYFPDQECKVILPLKAIHRAQHVIIYRSLNFPNNKLIELILTAQGCRDYAVEKVTLVAPFLSYMRQDKAFNDGEVVSQKIIGKLLAQYFDVVVTVDTHLHRIQKLNEAIPIDAAINLDAASAMAGFLKQQIKYPLLIGPDEESLQWIEKVAAFEDYNYLVAKKERLGDRKVNITLPEYNYHNREIVLLDDMASSGQTLVTAATMLAAYSPLSVSVLVTHGLFMDNAVQNLNDAGVVNIWSSDSVIHATNAYSLNTVLAEYLNAQ